jgi:hypothetical protein
MLGQMPKSPMNDLKWSRILASWLARALHSFEHILSKADLWIHAGAGHLSELQQLGAEELLLACAFLCSFFVVVFICLSHNLQRLVLRVRVLLAR